MVPFRPEPLSDFSRDEERREMAHAIASVAEQLDQSYGMRVGGEESGAETTFGSFNPSQPDERISTFPRGGAEQAARALAAAARAQAAWQATPTRERAAALRRCAEKLRNRRLELAAWVCFEAGWPWRDADAEVADALDLLEFHAAAAEEADTEGRLPEPRGPGVVLAPRQAPLAGALAAASAALVAGHAVVLKASSVVPTLAWKAVEALADAGVPGGVLNLVTSDDPAFAGALARHEAARFVCCGGGSARRDEAADRAGDAHSARVRGQVSLVEPPLSGVVVVDIGADLDEATGAIVAAAFACAGQRRGGCRRVIAHTEAYESLVERLTAAAGALQLGPAIDFTTDVGPLLDAPTARAVRHAVRTAARTSRVIAGRRGPEEPGAGHFIAPTVVADIVGEPAFALAEVGGPVVAATRARDLDEALALADATGHPCAAAVFTADAARAAAAIARLGAAGLHPRPRVGTDAARSFWARGFRLLD